ncbi:MAG: energy transducer TonB [Steroidobacteraceae bacterium]
MTTSIRTLVERPSRLIAWGSVGLIHVLFFLMLAHGMRINVPTILEAVQVSFLDTPAQPPVPDLSIPEVATPVMERLFVATPEIVLPQPPPVTVSVATTTSLPVAPTARPVVQGTSSITRLIVVEETEVEYLKAPEVRFPRGAKRAGEQGTVLLSVIVDTQGLVHNIRVYKTSGYRSLDDAAVKAVRQARFRPYTRNGMAVAVEVRIPVEFSLRNV